MSVAVLVYRITKNLCKATKVEDSIRAGVKGNNVSYRILHIVMRYIRLVSPNSLPSLKFMSSYRLAIRILIDISLNISCLPLFALLAC